MKLVKRNKQGFVIIDLFCGAGGTSFGFHSAEMDGQKFAEVLACVNHDPLAIKSHLKNFPGCLHFTEDVRPMVGIILKFPKRPPPPAINRGDLVRINQPGFAFDGFIGIVIDEPTDDGFDLTDGNCIVVCLQGKVLKECRRRRARYGLPTIKTTYTVLKHGNEL